MRQHRRNIKTVVKAVWIITAVLLAILGESADLFAGDARFFGTYCGSYEETEWVPGFLFIPFPVTYRFSVRAEIEYRENSRGNGVLGGRGRVEGEGRRVPFVFTGLVTRLGRAEGSVTAPGVDPVTGRADLSADGNRLSLRGLDRTIDLYKDRCGNNAPTAAIERPEHDHEPFLMGETISFVADIHDTEDTLPLPSERMVWYSSRNGILGQGNPIYRDDLAPGAHTITFSATDSGGRTAMDTVTMTVSNDPPGTPVIHRPRPDDIFCADQEIPFEGEARDPEEGFLNGDALVWESSLDGPLREAGMRVSQALSPGRHHITLTATDSGGLSRNVTVGPVMVVTGPEGNMPPSVSIRRPEGDDNSLPFSFIAMGNGPDDCYRLEAVASDCQDSPDRLTYEWRDYSSCSPPGGNDLGNGRSVEFCGLCNPGGGGDVKHDIVVTVTDTGGLTATATFNVYVIWGGLF